MPTQVIDFGDGSHAILTKADDDTCEKGGLHDFSDSVLTYRTRRGEERYILGNKYYLNDAMNDGRPKPIHRRMRIIMGQSACSKCGCPYTHAHNPYFL